MTILSDPSDRQFFGGIAGSADAENVLTLGAASYIKSAELSVFAENKNFPHILIGRFCAFADKIYFAIGGNHNYKNVSTFPFDVDRVLERIFKSANALPFNRPNHYQVIIGHDVWIGQGATIMGGVKIGTGAAIGANAVVAKDIPPYAIVVGNPARVIKYRFDEETIRKFLAIKWWNWDLEKIADNLSLMNDVEKFLEAHYSPALETFPEDEFSRRLKDICERGDKIYHFIPDFRAKNPLWLKVIADFCQSDFENSLLVIWLDKNSTEKDFNLLGEAANAFNNGASKNILTVESDENFSPAALRKGTYFITTCEMSTLEALDYLWNTDVKIISALDNNIFGG